MDNFRFQSPILAAQEMTRANRSHKPGADAGIKRVFRLGGERKAVRQAGTR
ncbi:MAG: hypothetical protein ABI578_08625 [Chloroflexota bacterium]